MKIAIASLILLFITTSSFGQKNFEKGYFVDNENIRTDCWIKNSDSRFTPSLFYYKVNPDDQPLEGKIKSIKEFGIGVSHKFIRAEVKIDRSGYRLEDLTTDRGPIWKDETIFLRVLVEGKASLFVFEDEDIKKFFISISDSPIHQLIYKRYLIDNKEINGKEEILNNNQFQQQLWTEIRSPSVDLRDIERVGYFQGDLVRYVENYNQAIDGKSVKYSDLSQKNSFNLKVTPGITVSSMEILHPTLGTSEISSKGKVDFRIGLEAEFIFPYYRNKWSVFLEPNFQHFQAEKGADSYPNMSIQFNTIDFPVGLRHYFLMGKQTKLFLNGLYISKISFNINSKVTSSTYSIKDIDTRASYAMGGGIAYRKASLEFRYYTKRDFLGSYPYWDTDYTRFSLIAGFQLFQSGHK